MKIEPFSRALEKIIHEFGHPTRFPQKVLEEVEKIPDLIHLEGRVDLRGEATVTIDGEKARDFDDAVSVAPLPEGGWRLKVSIADVSYYVKAGSAVDREAFHRGTSVYFPDRVIPMLPEKLSNHLCSLVPNEDRLTFTAEMDFDPEGRRSGARFYRSVIRSCARLTYTLVQQMLDGKSGSPVSSPLLLHVREMEKLFSLLRKRRLERGSLDFDLPEPEILIDMESGEIGQIVRAERYDSHRIIEEFMIAANEAVAEFLEKEGVPSLYRVHESPDREKTEDFFILLHNLGFQVPRGKTLTPKVFSAVIRAIRGRPEERLLNTLLLRTMKQAYYDPKNKGHFGLASRCYTHFTSPIRRYPDLVVHRVLGEVAQSSAAEWRQIPKRLSQIADHCSERERNAMKTEWAVRDLAAVYFMKDKVGEVYPGIISSVTKFGLFVELVSWLVEGLIPLRALTDDYYLFDEKHHRLAGRRTKKRYQIGDAVWVKVKGFNLDRRWLDFILEKSL